MPQVLSLFYSFFSTHRVLDYILFPLSLSSFPLLLSLEWYFGDVKGRWKMEADNDREIVVCGKEARIKGKKCQDRINLREGRWFGWIYVSVMRVSCSPLAVIQFEMLLNVLFNFIGSHSSIPVVILAFYFHTYDSHPSTPKGGKNKRKYVHKKGLLVRELKQIILQIYYFIMCSHKETIHTACSSEMSGH